MEATLVVAGIAFIGAAIAGGGLVAFRIEVPLIDSVVRQIMLAGFGVLLLLSGVVLGIDDSDPADSVVPLGVNRNVDTTALESTTSAATTGTVGSTTSTLPPDTTTTSTNVRQDELRFTTYYWDEGWIEHASWQSPPPTENMRPALSAYNFSPDHPALTVQFDDFVALGVTNDFSDGVIPSAWDVIPTPGASAEESGGKLVLRIPEGKTPNATESRLDLWPPIQLGAEFDISVRFSLDSDFYSLRSGGLSLLVSGSSPVPDQVMMTMFQGSYRSEQQTESDSNVGAMGWESLATSEAWQVEGGLRIQRTYVNG